MSGLATSYALEAISPYPFDGTVLRVRGELANEGFDVVSEPDVATMLGDHPPYLVLGVCNPPLAQRALAIEPQLGVFLPWNVLVYETPEGAVRVAAVEPRTMLAATGNEELRPIVEELRALLERVVRRSTRT